MTTVVSVIRLPQTVTLVSQESGQHSDVSPISNQVNAVTIVVSLIRPRQTMPLTVFVILSIQ